MRVFLLMVLQVMAGIAIWQFAIWWVPASSWPEYMLAMTAIFGCAIALDASDSRREQELLHDPQAQEYHQREPDAVQPDCRDKPEQV